MHCAEGYLNAPKFRLGCLPFIRDPKAYQRRNDKHRIRAETTGRAHSAMIDGTIPNSKVAPSQAPEPSQSAPLRSPPRGTQIAISARPGSKTTRRRCERETRIRARTGIVLRRHPCEVHAHVHGRFDLLTTLRLPIVCLGPLLLVLRRAGIDGVNVGLIILVRGTLARIRPRISHTTMSICSIFSVIGGAGVGSRGLKDVGLGGCWVRRHGDRERIGRNWMFILWNNPSVPIHGPA